jgi:DNA-nicking Smr family endonuclease
VIEETGESSMEFADILDRWDRQSSKPQCKKTEVSGGGEAAPVPRKKANPLDIWLRRNGVYDKDAEIEETRDGHGERRRRLLRKAPEAAIDLHAMTQDEARAALDDFFRSCRSQGLEKIQVVHGKGNHSDGGGILRDLTRKFIEDCPFAGESGFSSAEFGGRGATWVLLKVEGRSPSD